MEQLSTTIEGQAEAPETSTQLDEQRQPDAANAHKPQDEPQSRMDAIKRAVSDVEKAEPAAKEKPDEGETDKPVEKVDEAEKPVDKEKAQTDDEGAEKAGDERRPGDNQRADEKQRRAPIEPPENFLPRAKELWHNTPHEVRSELTRVLSEAQNEASTAREATAEYEAIKPFAEMARQSGTTLDKALSEYVRMENELRENPASGFRALMQNMGMSPPQAIAHILAAFNVQPERLAAHIQQDPNAYTALAPRPQQHQQQHQPQPQQVNPEVEQLRRQVAQMQTQTLEATVIAPFANENPRYYELQGHIAKLLQSDIVPANLSLHDRLAAAYDMAVRLSPSTHREAAPASDIAPTVSESRAGDDFGGTKSIRGAPASGVDTTNRRKGKVSRSEAIAAAMSDLGIAS